MSQSIIIITADAHIPAHEQLLFDVYRKLAPSYRNTRLIDLSAFAILPQLLPNKVSKTDITLLTRKLDEALLVTDSFRKDRCLDGLIIEKIGSDILAELDYRKPLDLANEPLSLEKIFNYISTCGCQIGHTPALESILHKKKLLQDLCLDELYGYMQCVVAADLAQQALSLALKHKHETPDSLVFYNDYLIQQSIRQLGIQLNIPIAKISGVAGSGNQRDFFISDLYGIEDRYIKRLLWPSFGREDLPKAAVQAVYDTLRVRIGSPSAHVYSPANIPDQSVKQLFGVAKNKKIITYFTSSSEEYQKDIILSSLSPIRFPSLGGRYNNQDQIIKELLEFASDKVDSFHLIVRIHPRAGADKRGLGSSYELDALYEIFSSYKLENLSIVSPYDKISSYWLGLSSDLSIVQASTIALELACLGARVHVACIDNGLFSSYPPSNAFTRYPDDQDIKETIEHILSFSDSSIEKSISSIRDAVSFMYFSDFYFMHNLNELTPAALFALLSTMRSPLSQYGLSLDRQRFNTNKACLSNKSVSLTIQPDLSTDQDLLINICLELLQTWRLLGPDIRKNPRSSDIISLLRPMLI